MRADQARRNQTQDTLEDLKTAAREHFGVDGSSASVVLLAKLPVADAWLRKGSPSGD